MIARILPMGVLAFGAMEGADKVKEFLAGTQEVAVQYEVGEIIKIIELDYITEGRLPDPKNFSKFVSNNMRARKQGRDTSKDIWGTPYKLEIKGQIFEVRSAGPDMEYNTDDDIYGVGRPY